MPAYKLGFGWVAVICAMTVCAAPDESAEWPQEIYLPQGKIVIYQPQPETFKDGRLTARAAVSVTKADAKEPVFGVVWFDSRIATDRDVRTVTILNMKVSKVKFPDATPDQEKELAKILGDSLPKICSTFSLDRLMAGLDLAEKEQVAAGSLVTAPPKIIFSTTPAVLVTIDGKPKLQAVSGSTIMRVVNTPFVILFDTSQVKFYLKSPEGWLSANDITGDWKIAEHVPAEVLAAAPAEVRTTAPQNATPAPSKGGAPRVIVATEPTELIVADGTPTWTPVDGAGLLYMSNTGSDLFMDAAAKQYYIALAGRWYRSASLNGPWAYVASDKLPAAFAKIPPDSPKGRVLAYVAGTEQANDAVLDASIPQTAEIKRAEAKLTVTYDGEPRFEAISGTKMSYAVNTSYAVIRVKGKYYCCDQAVWYSSDSPTGPWAVCTSVPNEIYTIPPNCPLYNVRYVSVYDSTPDTVCIGYLPGYVGSYVYGGTVVYGTGYWYPGWYGNVYYPRPWTWGFDPVFYPWTGNWYFGTGPWGRHWAYWGDGQGGWWGPNGFHHWGNIAEQHNISYKDGKITIGDKTYTKDELRQDIQKQRGEGKKITIGDKTYTPGELKDNIYRRRDNLPRNLPAKAQSLLSSKAAAGLDNNVFASRDGNVYRLKDSWEQYGKGGWIKSFPPPSEGEGREVSRAAAPAAEHHDFGGHDITQIRGLSRPAASEIGERQYPRPSTGFDPEELNKQNWARQRGEERSAGFQRDFSQRNMNTEWRRSSFEGGRRDFGGGRPSFHGGGGRRR